MDWKTIDDAIRMYHEERDRQLVEVIKNYDFIVGSAELKEKIEDLLPEGANVVYSRFLDDPTAVYAVKKFEISPMQFVVPGGQWKKYCYQNYECSNCGYIVADDDVAEYRFCPNCGADMRGGEE